LYWTEKLKSAAAAPQGRPTWIVLLWLAALVVAAAIMMR
jgi:hypothetical protein